MFIQKNSINRMHVVQQFFKKKITPEHDFFLSFSFSFLLFLSHDWFIKVRKGRSETGVEKEIGLFSPPCPLN